MCDTNTYVCSNFKPGYLSHVNDCWRKHDLLALFCYWGAGHIRVLCYP